MNNFPAMTEEQRQALIDALEILKPEISKSPALSKAVEIALAALTAEPELWEIVNPGEGTFYSPHGPRDFEKVKKLWYTAPPAPVLKPIVLPGKGGVEATSERSIRDWSDGWSAYREEAIKAIHDAGYEVKL